MVREQDAVTGRENQRLSPDELPRSNPEDIKSSIAEVRNRMDRTLDELSDRLEPGRVLDYALGLAMGLLPRTKEQARTWTESAAATTSTGFSRLADTVRRNPIPALLIGAGALWAVFGSSSRTKPPARQRRSPFIGSEPRALYTEPVPTVPTSAFAPRRDFGGRDFGVSRSPEETRESTIRSDAMGSDLRVEERSPEEIHPTYTLESEPIVPTTPRTTVKDSNPTDEGKVHIAAPNEPASCATGIVKPRDERRTGI